jgi:hypothetical protein
MATRSKPEIQLRHLFVDSVPDDLEEGTLYVSIAYATAIHKCCCGCGRQVVTPFSPTEWKMTFDGVSLSLWPSIGNWQLPCRSHYWIRHDRVRWAEDWSEERIALGRAAEDLVRARYYGDVHDLHTVTPAAPDAERGNDAGDGKRPGDRPRRRRRAKAQGELG